MKTNKLINKSFRFKQFSIEEGTCGMPISTDGVLLGSWAFSLSPTTILDIGCGTGLLSLMCAQRFPHAHITALDIEQSAYQAAEHNRQQSPWLNASNANMPIFCTGSPANALPQSFVILLISTAEKPLNTKSERRHATPLACSTKP